METARCRLCNEGSPEMHRIFPDSEEIDCESPIAIKIHKCISLQLPEEADDLDAQVCQGCLRQLDAFYTFRIKCRKTNSLFRRERRCKVQNNTQETVPTVGSNLDMGCIADEGCKAKSEEEPEKTGTPGADIEPNLLHDFLPEDLLSVTIEDDFNTTSSISELKESLLADLIQNDQEPACVKCSFCSVGFSNAVELKLHNECHKEQQQLRDGNYQCDHCDAKFKLYSNLLTHRRSHTGERPYACQLCGKAFSTSSNLKTHMNVHSDERPYKCGICFKSFNTENRHRLHLERHDMGEVLGDSAEATRCRICGKTFSHPSYLTVHYRIHNGDRPFQCKLCSSTFTTSGNLKVHLKTHAKDKHRPYKCPFCPKTFLHASNLSVHKKTVHYEPKAQWSLRQAV